MQYSEVLSFARQLRKNQTDAENFFWSKVKGKRIYGFKINRQYVFKYKLGFNYAKYFIFDFYCHQRKLIIELDGKYHQYQLSTDKERDEITKAYGLSTIRFTNDQVVNEWANVEERLLEFLTPKSPRKGTCLPRKVGMGQITRL